MSDNTGAFAALDRYVEFIKSVPNIGKEAAPLVAAELEKQLSSDIAKGVTPYGDKFHETKDGHQPLAGAMKAITVSAAGSVVLISLDGIEVLHHIGAARGYHGGSAAKGGFRRTLIPITEKGLPGFFKGRIRGALTSTFQHLRHTEKGRRRG